MNTAIAVAPIGAQVERRSLDVLWQEIEALKPKRVDIESPAIFTPFGKPPHTKVVLNFERDGDSLSISSLEPGLHAALERVLEKTTVFGIKP